jgi:hypothetical protein
VNSPSINTVAFAGTDNPRFILYLFLFPLPSRFAGHLKQRGYNAALLQRLPFSRLKSCRHRLSLRESRYALALPTP